VIIKKKGEKLVKNGKIQNNIITRGVVLFNRPMSVCNIIPYGTVYYSTFSSIIRALIPFWNSLDRFLNGPRTKNDRKKCFMSKSTAVFVMITSSVKIKTTLPHYRLSRYTQWRSYVTNLLFSIVYSLHLLHCLMAHINRIVKMYILNTPNISVTMIIHYWNSIFWHQVRNYIATCAFFTACVPIYSVTNFNELLWSLSNSNRW